MFLCGRKAKSAIGQDMVCFLHLTDWHFQKPIRGVGLRPGTQHQPGKVVLPWIPAVLDLPYEKDLWEQDKDAIQDDLHK